MTLIKVSPAPGKRIINPFTGAELRPGTMPDDPFWHRRAAEGGVIIEPVSAVQPSAPAAPAVKSSIVAARKE